MSKILVSACLIGENCKYSGGNNLNKELAHYLEKHEVIKVCPEVMGGMDTPRLPCEIVNGIVTNCEGVSCDEQFRRGAQVVLELARDEQPDYCILQSRSPSCGSKQIYDGTFSKQLIPGQGVCAKLLMEHGFKVIDSEDWRPEYRRFSSEEDVPDCGCIYG